MSAKKDDPKKIAALSAGIIVAVGFAGWNINNAVNPPQPTRKPAPRPTDAALTEAAGARQDTGEVPGTAPAGTPEPAASAPGTEALPAPEPAFAGPQGAARASEAQLAFDVDPFVPFPDPDQKPAPAPGAKLAGHTPGDTYTGPKLPPAGPAPTPRLDLSAPAEPEPTLLGTLLGERPSAVFGGEGGMRIVPVGGRLGSWKVVAVSHGRAVVKSARATRSLAVSGAAAGEVRVAAPEPAPVAAEPRPEVMAMMTSMTVTVPEAAPPPLAAPARRDGTLPAPAPVPAPGPEPSPPPEALPAPEVPPGSGS